MIVEKNEKTYTVTETLNKWVVKSDIGKLSVSVEISKELCNSFEDIQRYLYDNDELF